jgi:hypothetical protein
MCFLSFTQSAGLFISLLHLLPLAGSFTFVQNSQRLSLTANPAASFSKPLELSSPHSRSVPSFVVLFESKQEGLAEAEVLPAIQDVFNKYCDKDGLMTKASLVKMPPFEQMLVRRLLSCHIS